MDRYRADIFGLTWQWGDIFAVDIK